MIGLFALSGGLYCIYRLGVWWERRHKERCFICAAEIDLVQRDWKPAASYWDSSTGRWAHLPCKMEQIEEIRKVGGL